MKKFSENPHIVFNEKRGLWHRPKFLSDIAIYDSIAFHDEYKMSLYSGSRGRELVIDVGSHIGSFAMEYHKKNPEAFIVCVEANPDNIEVLTKNVGGFAKILFGAVSYEKDDLFILDSVVEGYGYRNSSGVSMIINQQQAIEYRTLEKNNKNTDYILQPDPVTKYTLEHIAKMFGCDKVGVLKLDCEGSEFSILLKSEIIQRTQTIFGEFHHCATWDWCISQKRLDMFAYGEMARSWEGGIFHLENKRFDQPSAPPFSIDDVFNNPHYLQKAKTPKVLRVVTPRGIGDNLWVFTKIQSLMEKENAASVEIVLSRVLDSDDMVISLRAADFIKRFDFVSSVSTCEFDIVEDPPLDSDGQWRVVPSQPGWHWFDWMMCANGHLEHGMRLEDWMPEFKINWNVMKENWIIDLKEVQAAKELTKSDPYLCVYFGSTASNTKENHNRGPRWYPEHWIDLLSRLGGVHVFVLGASYDLDYYRDVISPMINQHNKTATATNRINATSLISQTAIGVTVELIRYSGGLIAFQSGLGCISGLLDVPTVMWWRKKGDSIHWEHYISYDEAENGAFVPKYMLNNGHYIPAIYPGPEGMVTGFKWTPEAIAGLMKRDWPIFKGVLHVAN